VFSIGAVVRWRGVVVTAVTVSMVSASVMLGAVPAGATPQVVVPDVAKAHSVLPVTVATHAAGQPSARLTPAAAIAHGASGNLSPVRSFLPAGMPLCPSVNGSKVSPTASCGHTDHLAVSEVPVAGGGTTCRQLVAPAISATAAPCRSGPGGRNPSVAAAGHAVGRASVSQGALFVRPAMFAATVAPTTVSLSYTSVNGGLILTATTDQPLEGTGLWVEIFESSYQHIIWDTQYLGWCNTGTTCTVGPAIPRTSQATYVATLGSIGNDYPPGVPVATSNTVTPPAWAVSLAVSGTTVNGTTLTATTNYDLSYPYGNSYTELFDLTATGATTWLGWCKNGTTCTLGAGTSSHRFLATVGGLSNNPVPSPLLAVSNSVGTAGPTGAYETAGGGNEAELNACFSCAGDPFNTSTGEFFTNESDVKVAGRGPGLNVTRSYSSQLSPYDGPLGPGWSFTYGMALSQDPTSGLVTVHQENGSVVTFTPNGSGGYTAPTQVLATLVHNGDGSWTYTRRARQVFGFGSSGQLNTIRDLNGETVTVAHTTGGQISTVTDGAGRALTFTYNPAGRIATITDPAGRVAGYGYDASGRLSSATMAGGAVTSYGYDASNLMTTRTDPNGHVTTNTYDVAHRIITQVGAAGGTTTIGYGSDDSTTVTSPSGRVVVDLYTNGELTSVTRGAGTPQAGTWTFTYDPATFALATASDPNAHTSTYTVDSAGNRLTATDANAHTSSWTYDSLNDVLTATDRNGHTTTNTYDARGNLLTTSRPLGTQTQTIVDTRGSSAHPGDVTSVTDPTGHVSTLTYDANGNPATSVDPAADTTTVLFDVLGRRASITTPRAKTTTYTYNTAGYLWKVTDALGHITTNTYDAAGNQASVTDPAGHTTTNTYDGLNHLVTVVAAGGATSTKTYDSDGNQIGQSDPLLHATTYGYDAQDRPVSSTDPASRTTSYGHDPAGNLTSMTDPTGRITTYGYDPANRRTTVTYSDGATPNVSYTYTPAGQRASMVDGTGTTTYTYDSLDRLTALTNGAAQHSGYAYDLSGHLTTLTYPNTHTVTRGYDSAGRLTSITDWLGHTTTVAPDADGNTATTTYGNAVVATSSFDATDQMSATSIAGPTGALASLTYTRDANSRVASAAPTGLPGSAETYAYTARGQLSSVNTGTYAYDAAGNPTTLADGTTQAFSTANQLTTSTSAGATTSYTYDGLGNQSAIVPPTGNQTSYAYDQAQRLTTSVQKGALYLPLTPARIADTRTGSGMPYAGQPLAPGGTLNVQAAGRGGVPTTGVAAVVVNVTEASATVATNLTVFPTGVARPATSNINALATGYANNEVTVPVGTGGQVSIYNSAGTTNVVVDVLGYYSSGGAGMNTITPTRIADTRTGSGQPYAGQTIAANGSLTVQISGTAGVPTSATAAILQTSVLTPTAAGNLTAYPAGSTRPVTSNVNYKVGVTLTKEITAGLGTSPSGAVTFYNSSNSPVNLILDLTGYINTAGDTLTPLTPARIADTRTGSGQPYAGQTIPAGGTLAIQVTGRGGVPANARSVVVNMTVPGNTTAGYLTAYPTGTHPATTTLTYAPGAAAFNQVTVKLSPTGTFTIWNYGGTADVIIDVMGSYGPMTTSTYTYNGDGLRTTRTTTTGTQNFAWDPTSSTPLMLTDGAISYIYDDNGNPLEQIDAVGVALYYQHDQYGSTRLLTNAAGAIAASYTYNAYGTLTTHTGTADTPLRWNGQYQDTDTGLYYLRARYYNPVTTQFLTPDPLVALTAVAYVFGGSNPLNNVDPRGLDFWNPSTWSPDTQRNVGIGLGFTALALTGVGIFVPLTFAATALVGGLGLATGLGAVALDYSPCVNGGDTLACGGAMMGAGAAAFGAPGVGFALAGDIAGGEAGAWLAGTGTFLGIQSGELGAGGLGLDMYGAISAKGAQGRKC
jgi:RHS repeat-associated protein